MSNKGSMFTNNAKASPTISSFLQASNILLNSPLKHYEKIPSQIKHYHQNDYLLYWSLNINMGQWQSMMIYAIFEILRYRFSMVL